MTLGENNHEGAGSAADVQESEARYLHRRMDTIAHDVQSLRTGVAESNAKMDRVLHALNGPHPLGEGALIHTAQVTKQRVEALEAEVAILKAAAKNAQDGETNALRNAKWSMAVAIFMSLLSLLASVLRGH